MSVPSLFPLSLLGRRLKELTGHPAPPPHQLYDYVVRGVIDAQMIGGRWFIDETKLPAIADALGMTVQAA